MTSIKIVPLVQSFETYSNILFLSETMYVAYSFLVEKVTNYLQIQGTMQIHTHAGNIHLGKMCQALKKTVNSFFFC